MKKLICFFLFLPIFSFSQTSSAGFNVLNPDQNWSKTPAHFESIEVLITPAGTHANVDIEMEVSAQYSNLSFSNDSLEIEYKFSLPDGSVMHEAWLWMQGVPIKGELYERNRARLIYEALVSRKVDPLILYQNENNTYEARIFPILNPAPRKIKLSYLVPIQASASGITVPLSLELFKESIPNTIAPNIKISVVNNSFWGQPDILPNTLTSTVSPTITEMNLVANDSTINTVSALHFNAPTTLNQFITQPSAMAGSGYYQMMLFPSAITPPKKYVFVLDYTNGNGSVSYANLINSLQSQLYHKMSSVDSFNIIYTNNSGAHSASTNWILADSTGINFAFNQIPNAVNNNASLSYLILNTAVNFINNHGAEGDIFVLTNGPSLGSQTAVLNQLVNSAKNNMNNTYPIYTYDFHSSFQYSFYVNPDYYINNEYFYRNISLLTGGEFIDRRVDNGYPNYNSPVLNYSDMLLLTLNFMDTKCGYDAITYNYNGGVLTNEYQIPDVPFRNAREAYMEVGKYNNASGNIVLNHYYGVDTGNYQVTQNLTPLVSTDTFTKKIWAIGLIQDLLNNNSNDIYTNLIINSSKEYEVLTPYTAFLALEPDTITGTITNNPTSTTDLINEEKLEVSTYPNPFSNRQEIKIKLSAQTKNETWRLDVVDITGRVFKSMQGNSGSQEHLTVNWYNNDLALSQGVYFLKLSIGNSSFSIKVIKLNK